MCMRCVCVDIYMCEISNIWLNWVVFSFLFTVLSARTHIILLFSVLIVERVRKEQQRVYDNGYQLNEFKLHYYHMIELMNGMHIL